MIDAVIKVTLVTDVTILTICLLIFILKIKNI